MLRKVRQMVEDYILISMYSYFLMDLNFKLVLYTRRIVFSGVVFYLIANYKKS